MIPALAGTIFVVDQTAVKPGSLSDSMVLDEPLASSCQEGARMVGEQGARLGGRFCAVGDRVYWTLSDSVDLGAAARVVDESVRTGEVADDPETAGETATAVSPLGDGWTLSGYGPDVSLSGATGPAWLTWERSESDLPDDDTLLSVLPRGRKVTLAAHSRDVATRAELMAQRCGLPDDLVEVLRLSGQYHDAGKALPEFQSEVLLNRKAEEPLAKSRARSTLTWRRRLQSRRLPKKWRHEQLSAAIAFADLADHESCDLIVRLVGTSHGRGRSLFPHRADALVLSDCDKYPGAIDLFGDQDRWTDVLECTENKFGIWGCAYLESVLRAADCQVSSEGR